MRKHTRVYLDYFGFGEYDFIPCEVCKRRAQDIHHIKSRGMGGTSRNLDVISNLMALCRRCHEYYGDKKQFLSFLKSKHEQYVSSRGL